MKVALHKLLRIVGAITKASRIVAAVDNVVVQIFIDLHQIKDSSLHNNKTPIRCEILTLEMHSNREFVKGEWSDMAPGFHAKRFTSEREQECKRAEVIVL